MDENIQPDDLDCLGERAACRPRRNCRLLRYSSEMMSPYMLLMPGPRMTSSAINTTATKMSSRAYSTSPWPHALRQTAGWAASYDQRCIGRLLSGLCIYHYSTGITVSRALRERPLQKFTTD